MISIDLVILLAKIFLVLNIVLGLASLCTWIERKGSALIQDRIGANRAGAFYQTDNIFLKPFVPFIRIFGMLGVINTLLCDAVKAIMKEDFVPEGTSQFLHSLAPVLAAAPVFIAFSVIPFAPEFVLWGYTIRPQLASIDAGILFILAMGSIGIYGVVIAGWGGNNKYSLLGALRAASQMISYELALGMSLVSAVVVYGTLDLFAIVELQQPLIFGFLPSWGILLNPLGFVILFVAGMAEVKRGPFDLPESESELVAGYFTEYSGMKFLIFWLGEFAEIALISALVSILFFGGWDIPYLELEPNSWVTALLGHLSLMAKIVFFCIVQIVIRWTVPRFRFDQVMNLGWKMLLPLSIVNVILVGALKIYL